MIDTNPRLPHIGSPDYQKQLNARLYELLRQMAQDINSISAGNVPQVTTTEKGALTPRAGTIVFDTTLSKACVYSGSAWQTITSV